MLLYVTQISKLVIFSDIKMLRAVTNANQVKAVYSFRKYALITYHQLTQQLAGERIVINKLINNMDIENIPVTSS